jgi:hypothetical protein
MCARSSLGVAGSNETVSFLPVAAHLPWFEHVMASEQSGQEGEEGKASERKLGDDAANGRCGAEQKLA